MLDNRKKMQLRLLAGCQPIHHRQGEENKPITYTVGYLTDEQLKDLQLSVDDIKNQDWYDGMESIMTADGEHVHQRVHTFDIPKLEEALDTTHQLAKKFVAANGQLYR